MAQNVDEVVENRDFSEETDEVGAVKIVDLEYAYTDHEFKNEIATLSCANHQNIINLVGKCFVVYEPMPKSLANCLYDHESPALDWVKRLKIAQGVANSLIYLHDTLKVIHRDVTVENVVLGENFEPKLMGFGLATKITVDSDGVERQKLTNHIKGRRCYIAPETVEYGLVSTKSDVYSFGVFLLSLLTGRKAYDATRSVQTRNITDLLKPAWSRKELLRLVMDPSLGNRIPENGLDRLVQAARMCMDPQVLSRPDMKCVEAMVTEAASNPVPNCAKVTHRVSFSRTSA